MEYFVDSQLEMFQALANRYMANSIREKLSKYQTHILSSWIPVSSFEIPVIIGSFSIFCPSTQERWMLESQARYYFGFDLPCTPTDISRAYIEYRFPDSLRWYKRQAIHFTENPRATPLYAMPNEYDYGYYVDLKSAYWNILSTFSWDVDYMPNEFIGVKSDVRDFPYESDKMARNTLVTAGLPSMMKIWDGKRLTFKKKGNKHKNIVLWALICDILHGIASDVIEAGATYAYTDGYIVSHERLESVQNAILEWGLPFAIKHEGQTVVKSTGSYKVGEYESRPYHLNRSHYVDTVKKHSYHSWLRSKCRFWTNKRRELNKLDKSSFSRYYEG